MENFNEYHLNPAEFSFLETLQDNWLVIRDEFKHFTNNASSEEIKFTYEVLGPKVKLLKQRAIPNIALLVYCSKVFL